MSEPLCPHCLQPLRGRYEGNCPHCGRSLENRNPEGALPLGSVLAGTPSAPICEPPVTAWLTAAF